jgi:predicted Zn-dependent peptidase
MVFKGSGQLAAGEFDRRIEALGGSSNAATGFDDVHYHVLVPPSAAAEAVDLLLDLVLAPRLDGQDFDMERQVVLEELAQSEDQPEEVAFQQLLSRACPGHAYGQPILGRREALEGHRAEAMAAFHQRLYRADNCCLAVAGPLGDGAILEHLEHSALSRLASADQPRSSSTGPASSGTRSEAAPLQLQPGSDTVVLPRLEAARLLMAWQVPPAGDLEAVIGCDLLTTLLAEGRRSRLVARLREQLRLVESIDLDLNGLEAGSLVLLEAVCESEHLPAVEAEIHRVLQELIGAPPPLAEVERAQRLVGNGYRFGLEAAGSVAGLLGNNHLWGRHQPIQAPLDALAHWDPQRLWRELTPLLDPERAFCLRALPA